MAEHASPNQEEKEKEAAEIARREVESGMWNLNLMAVFYVILAAVIILELQGVAIGIVIMIAFSGLLLIWLLARMRYKRLYKLVFQRELQHLQELSQKGQPKTASGMDVPPPIGEVDAASVSSPLTLRQSEILSYIACGYSNKEIGAHINLSEQTVKNQVRTIFRKLGVEDRTQAVLTAMHRGWISPVSPQTSSRDTEEVKK